MFVEGLIREKLSRIEDPAEAIKSAIQEMAENLDTDESEKISLKSTKKVSVNLVALETFSSNENLRKACESAFDACPSDSTVTSRIWLIQLLHNRFLRWYQVWTLHLQ